MVQVFVDVDIVLVPPLCEPFEVVILVGVNLGVALCDFLFQSVQVILHLVLEGENLLVKNTHLA